MPNVEFQAIANLKEGTREKLNVVIAHEIFFPWDLWQKRRPIDDREYSTGRNDRFGVFQNV
jgi:hypothetical protein